MLPWNGPLSIPDGTDLLINATAMGLLDLDARIPLKLETLERTLLVADVVFNPPSTWLLNVAEQRGCTIVNGLGMLVNQAALDFKIWTGLDPDLAVMREAVEEFLEI